MKFTEDILMVRPINNIALEEYLRKSVPLPHGEKYDFRTQAVFQNSIIDCDCCYSIADKLLVDGEVQCADIIESFWIITDIDGKGSTSTRRAGFSFIVPLSFLVKTAHPEISLKEFMGSRYNYNPRIKQNMKEMLEDFSSQN